MRGMLQLRLSVLLACAVLAACAMPVFADGGDGPADDHETGVREHVAPMLPDTVNDVTDGSG